MSKVLVAKKAPTRKESAKLRRAKKTQAAMSLASGTLGLTALGTMGAAAALRRPSLARHVKFVKDPKKTAEKLTGTTAGLVTAGAGVGGAGSLNFARVQNQEANRLPNLPKKRVVKSFGGGTMDFGLSNVRQGESVVSKAYDPERSRRKRLDAYATGSAGVGGGALGLGLLTGRDTVRGVRSAAREWGDASAAMNNKVDGNKRPRYSVAANKYARGMKHMSAASRSGGKTAALGALGVAGLVGSDRIREYSRGKGRTYGQRRYS